MTDTLASREHPRGKRKHDTGNYRQRLKVAGLDDDTMPDDIDEFRRRLARRIAMFINQWRGSPEPQCARNRGCMAPNGFCINVRQPSEEEMARDWPQVKFEVYKALKQNLAAAGWDASKDVNLENK